MGHRRRAGHAQRAGSPGRPLTMSQSLTSLLLLLVLPLSSLTQRSLEAGPRDESPGAVAAGPRVVFLVRHAERGEGQDPPLIDAGRERAKALARVLSGARIDAIYTSNATRTVQTAE